MNNLEKLVRFWKSLDRAEKPTNWIHPSDRERISETRSIHPESATALYRDYSMTEGSDSRIIGSLLPQPFIGSLVHRKVVIVLANPGFNPGDLHEMKNKEFSEVVWNNLVQQIPAGKFPFYFLNPEFAWHPGFRWWNRVLGRLITCAARRFESKLEALRFLADRISCIESFPYHSESFPGSWVLGLPSSTVAKAAVDHLVGQGDRLVHIMRPREWAKGHTTNHSLLVNPANQRNCALTDKQVRFYLSILFADE